MRIPSKFLQDAATVFVLVLSTEAFISFLVGGTDLSDYSQGSPVMKLAWGLVYAITCVRITKHWRLFVEQIRANKPLVLLVLLTFLSVLWSVEPSVTLRASVILIFSTAFAIDLTIRYSLVRQIELLCVALALVVGLSVVVELFLPAGFVPVTGGEFGEPSWHGVFGTKNEFGRMVALSVVAYLSLPRRPIWTKALVVVIGAVLGFLAKSCGCLGLPHRKRGNLHELVHLEMEAGTPKGGDLPSHRGRGLGGRLCVSEFSDGHYHDRPRSESHRACRPLETVSRQYYGEASPWIRLQCVLGTIVARSFAGPRGGPLGCTART